jgi:hypothetical protein
MLLASGKLEELIVRRKPLFEEFEKNPQRLHLSLEIKFIDDQIAECNEQIRLEKMSNASFVVMTLKCPQCDARQIVKVGSRTGFGQIGPQTITCLLCEKGFDALLPDRIISGPFRV